MEKVIIIGGSGFLGKKLENKLKEEFETVVFDKENGKDILKIEDFNGLKADYVIHLAALMRGVKDADLININVNGTKNVLEFCKNAKAKLVFASSAAVYGYASSPINEEAILCPVSIYGLTKLAGENACKWYFDKYNIQSTILRIFNMYGQGQQKGFLIPDIVSQKGQEEIKLGAGDSKRDFVYVDDIAEAIRKSLKLPGFDIINIGTGKSYSVKELVERIISNGRVTYSLETRKGDDIYADISKAKRVLNWQPRISLDEGLKKVIEQI